MTKKLKLWNKVNNIFLEILPEKGLKNLIIPSSKTISRNTPTTLASKRKPSTKEWNRSFSPAGVKTL